MARLWASIIFLVVACTARPRFEEPKVEKRTMTVEQFDGYVDFFKNFKDFIPAEILNTLTSLNSTQKGQVVDFLSDWIKGALSNPVNFKEFINVVKTNVPSIGQKIDSLNSSFYDKYNQLQPKSQQFLKTVSSEFFDDHSPNSTVQLSNEVSSLDRTIQHIQSMESDVREDLRKQFPTAVKLTEGLGFAVVTTLVMFVQKIAAGFAAPLMNAQPVECGLPLDRF